MAEDRKQEEQLAEGTLMSHLLELRNRLLKAVVAVLVAFIPCAVFANELFTLIAQPLIDKLPKGTSLIATSVVSPFMTPFKVSFYVALFIAIPVVLYQIWAFVAPGLYRREKRFAVPLLVSSVFLFYAGVVFAYFAVFPVMFSYLVLTAPAGVNYMPDMASYLDFVLTMFFAFGVAFEVPVAVVLLVLTGIVRVEKLAENRGYVIIGIFVVAAILTPPDAISQCIMAVPMYFLYEGGLIMARVMQKMRRESEEAREKEEAEAR
ncbi:MAG TPA: twin-arginine translocase subunit TatC [Steroidobacteraceae bacterium]|jgi:sec-independent protein translocase protein TatC|nr:twin-arginine translocase subunit TatC [Steroidobacteraceae bacterium]